jgi:hypothetical protein
MICIMSLKRAKVFQTGRNQAVRLPKEFRFEGDIFAATLPRSSGSPVGAETPEGVRAPTLDAVIVVLRQGAVIVPV